MPNPMPEMLAYARFQRAVNQVAVAELALQGALLHGSDKDVKQARINVGEALERLTVASGRAVAERMEALQSGLVESRPMIGAVGDGHDALEPDEAVPAEVEDAAEPDDFEGEPPVEEARPRIEHRSIGMDPVAACGAPMSESDPSGDRCQACEAELMKRLGTITHTSPSFGISSDTFRSR